MSIFSFGGSSSNKNHKQIVDDLTTLPSEPNGAIIMIMLKTKRMQKKYLKHPMQRKFKKRSQTKTLLLQIAKIHIGLT